MYRKQGAGGNGRHPETPTSGYCLSYPGLPMSRSLRGTWEGISAYTQNSRRVRMRGRYTSSCTYNETLYYISRTNNSGLEIGWRLRVAPKYLFLYSPSLLLFSCRTDCVPSRLRVLDSMFAVVLNGEENRSNVNARGTFATPMKTLVPNVTVYIAIRNTHSNYVFKS